jgi:sugar lactone lactonase YvrE
MTHTSSPAKPRPPALAVAVVALLATVLLAPASAAPRTADGHPGGPGERAFPARIDLPAGFQPEGIAIGPGPRAWFGSRVDGDIYGVDLVTGRGRIVSEGPGTAAVGLEVDHHGRLFVSGGDSGAARVVDTRTGEVLASYQLGQAPTFVNDVTLTREAAWFTDSQAPVLYRLPLGRGGSLPAVGAIETLTLSGDWEQVTGFNANGITPTPDGRGLLVVNSTTGALHRVDPGTGVTRVVDLGGYSLVNGDGMLLEGRTLYVVRNRLDTVAALRLDRRATRGTLVGTLTSPDFDVPTTVARFGPWLYLPNARFTTPPTPETPYWVTRVSAPPRRTAR